MYYLTGGGPGDKGVSGSLPNKEKDRKIQIPGLSIFRENIHWLSDGEERRGKSQKKRLPEDEKHRKTEQKRKDKKRERKDKKREGKSEIPETSIVPYRGTNSRDPAENNNLLSSEQSQGNLSDDLEGWDAVSIDSVSL